MRILATTVLLLTLAANPAAADARLAASDTENLLPVTAELAQLDERTERRPAPSVLDLSLFGIIALGIIGLFWIRRHTSEL